MMFLRRMSRQHQQEKMPTSAGSAKRISLMSVPENLEALRTSRTPPMRSKIRKGSRSVSFESIHREFEKLTKKDGKCKRERIIEWSECFKKLLADNYGTSIFLQYLETEHSAENIRFWIECEKYKKTSPDKLNEKARDMYNQFLCGNGSHQVNVDSCRVKEVKDELDKPNAWIFEKAQRDIFLLMKRDSYPRFLKSTQYMNLLNPIKHQ